MIFLIPWAAHILIYLFAALLPALFLMHYVYKKDKWEPEPIPMLFSLALYGVLAALISMVLEVGATTLLDRSSIDPQSPLYSIVMAFFAVAVIEEGAKCWLVRRRTWEDPNFNYRFDAIVYSAFVSLGFAAYENIHYVFTYGLSVAFPRAVLAIPGHLAFSVVFGCYYGTARLKADRGLMGASRANLLVGYLFATLLHGFYDTCTMIGSDRSLLIFLVFVVAMYVTVFRTISRESQNDHPLYH